MERRLEIRCVPHQIAELSRFPSVLGLIVSSIEDKAVGVQMGVGNTADRPRGQMHEFPVNQVARNPLLIGPALPHSRLDFRLQLLHRLPHRFLEHVQQPLIAGQCVKH